MTHHFLDEVLVAAASEYLNGLTSEKFALTFLINNQLLSSLSAVNLGTPTFIPVALHPQHWHQSCKSKRAWKWHMEYLGARPESGILHFTHILEVRKQLDGQTLLKRSWEKV